MIMENCLQYVMIYVGNPLEGHLMVRHVVQLIYLFLHKQQYVGLLNPEEQSKRDFIFMISEISLVFYFYFSEFKKHFHHILD